MKKVEKMAETQIIQSQNPNYFLVREYVILANKTELNDKEYIKYSMQTVDRFLPIAANELKFIPKDVVEINYNLYITVLEGQGGKLYVVVDESDDLSQVYIIRDDKGDLLTLPEKIMSMIKGRIEAATKAQVLAVDKSPLPEYVVYLNKDTQRNEFKEYKIMGEKIVIRYFFDQVIVPYKYFNKLFISYIEKNYKRRE